MKYKIGDKVKIKSLEWYKNAPKDSFGDIKLPVNTFVEIMSQYCGKEATIKNIGERNYKLSIDNGFWSWTDEMFEDIEPKDVKIVVGTLPDSCDLTNISISIEDKKIILNYKTKDTPKYEPKDGDFVTIEIGGLRKSTITYIFRKTDTNEVLCCYCCLIIKADIPIKYPLCISPAKISLSRETQFLEDIRPSTKEEIDILIEALKKDGKMWDAENKKIISYKWIPKKGESYYIPSVKNECKYDAFTWYSDGEDKRSLELGLVCKTAVEAIAKTDKMLKSIKQ